MYIRIQIEEGDADDIVEYAANLRDKLCGKFVGEPDFIENRVVIGDCLLDQNDNEIENEGFVHIFIDPDSKFELEDIIFSERE